MGTAEKYNGNVERAQRPGTADAPTDQGTGPAGTVPAPRDPKGCGTGQQAGRLPRGPQPSGSRLRQLDIWMHSHRFLFDILSVLALDLFLAMLGFFPESEGLLIPQPDSQTGPLLWGLLLTLPLLFRHYWPDLTALATMAVVLLQFLLGPAYTSYDIVALVALYDGIVLGTEKRLRLYEAGGIVLPLVSLVLQVHTRSHSPLLAPSGWKPSPTVEQVQADVPSLVLLMVMGLALCLIVIALARYRRMDREQARLLAERNRTLELAEREEAQAARQSEHARIARDMHDVIAHTLSIIIVQADGGRYAGARNSSLALSTMRTIRTETLQALSWMGQALLHDHPGEPGEPDDSSDRTGPGASVSSHAANTGRSPEIPDYAHIDRLIHEAQSVPGSWMEVTHLVAGDPLAQMDPHLSETLYRMVEEGLSNVRKYAQGDARNGDARAEALPPSVPSRNVVHVLVSESWGKDEVRLTIQDDGQGAKAKEDGHDPGYGLIGMRERVLSLGGTLVAGPGEPDRVIAGADRGQARTSPHADAVDTDSNPEGPEDGTGFTIQARIPLVPPRRGPETGTGTGGPSGPAPRKAKRPKRQDPIRRLHEWVHSHTFAVDTLVALLLLGVEACVIVPATQEFGSYSRHTFLVVSSQVLAFAGTCLPLCWRRLKPQVSAALCASSFFLALLLTLAAPTTCTVPVMIPLAGTNALIALDSVLLYGPERAHRWVYPACPAILLLASLSLSLTSVSDRDGTFHWEDPGRPRMVAISFLVFLLLTALIVLVVVFLPLARREKGDNILILKTHEQALLRERGQAARIAAQTERENVYRDLHVDINNALRTVLDSTSQALPVLAAIDARSKDAGSVSDADSTTIQRLFLSIATTGRAALAQTRELLRLLRRNETAPDAARVPYAPVTPAPIMTRVGGNGTSAGTALGTAAPTVPGANEE